MNEINKALFNKKILAFDSKTGRYSWVSPKILTTTIFNEKGENLDELLKVTPADLVKILKDILQGAPEAYNSFLEVSKALEENKDSITSLFREIDKRVSMPTENKMAGYVLKLDEDLNVVFGEDKNTEYDLSGFLTSKDLADYAKTKDIPKLPDLSVYAKSETLKDYAKSADLTKFVKLDATGKISVNDLPKEALENTEYDLSPYLLSDEAARLFALKSEIPIVDLSSYVKSESLKEYALVKDLDKYQALEKRGAVNGYAALGEDGKVPREQLPEEIFKNATYDLSSYAKIETLKDYALVEDLNSYVKKIDISEAADLSSYLKKEDLNRQKGKTIATLEDGKVPSSQLPSFVDDVLEFASEYMFPYFGEAGKIYIDLSTNKTYRWSGSSYVLISESLAIGETAQTAFAGDRGVSLEKNKADLVDGKVPREQLDLTSYVTNEILNAKNDIKAKDTRYSDNTPWWYMQNYDSKMAFEFKHRGKVGNPPANASSNIFFTLILTLVPKADRAGGYPTQISVGNTIAIRRGQTETSWGDWIEIPSLSDKNTRLSEMTDDLYHRLVTDTEKETWNGKANVVSLTLTEYQNLLTKEPNTLYVCKRY